MIFLCLHFPVESCHIRLLSNIFDFVPCDLQLQKAYFGINLSTYLFILYYTSFCTFLSSVSMVKYASPLSKIPAWITVSIRARTLTLTEGWERLEGGMDEWFPCKLFSAGYNPPLQFPFYIYVSRFHLTPHALPQYINYVFCRLSVSATMWNKQSDCFVSSKGKRG